MVPAAMHALLSMGGAAAAGGHPAPVHPRDTDWIIPAGAVAVGLFALGCVLAIILRWRRCSTTESKLQGVSMFEHECIVASLGMVLFLVVSLASLYYFFCYRGGCYGPSVLAAAGGPAPAIAGRKAKMTMGRRR